MPFARWESFDACVLEQKDAGHDEESARKICGAIQERSEKGELYKSTGQQNYDVICKSDTELVIGGFASWELVDPENDLITAQAQAKYLQKLFKLPPEYRNIMVGHSNFKIGEPLLKYAKDGQEYFSHVNEKGLYLLAKIRDDKFKTTQKWREKILKGEMNMYSIAGLPLETKYTLGDGGTVIREVHDIEPWEITVCEKGVNPKAQFKIIAKETLVPIEKRVEKRGNQWCVVHCHGPNAGESIKCFDTEEEAQAMHRAMQANKAEQPTKPQPKPAETAKNDLSVEEIMWKYGFIKAKPCGKDP